MQEALGHLLNAHQALKTALIQAVQNDQEFAHLVDALNAVKALVASFQANA